MTHSLVTGGAGFIGSHLVEALLARGHTVCVLDDESTGSAENLSAVRQHPGLRYVRGSAGDAATVRDLVAQADHVYHLAAAVGVALIARDPIGSIERNIAPTQLLLDELCRRATQGESPRFFLASSSEVYGKNAQATFHEHDDLVFGATTHVRWSYGVAKAIDEFLALACWRQHRLPVVVGRFFNVVGPRQTGAYGMVLPRFIQAAQRGAPLVVHDDGQQVRCFAHVRDVVRAVIDLMHASTAAGQVFNIGSDEAVTIGDLAQRVTQACGSRSRIAYQSYAEAYDADFEDVRRRVPNLDRLRATIDYRPQYDLAAIIAELAASRP